MTASHDDDNVVRPSTASDRMLRTQAAAFADYLAGDLDGPALAGPRLAAALELNRQDEAAMAARAGRLAKRKARRRHLHALVDELGRRRRAETRALVEAAHPTMGPRIVREEDLTTDQLRLVKALIEGAAAEKAWRAKGEADR